MNNSPILTIKDIILFFYLFAFKIATILPVKMIRLIGNFFVYIYSLLTVNKQKSLEKKLTLAFNSGKSRVDVKKIAKQYVLNAGFKDIDDLILGRLSKKEMLKCSTIKGLKNLEEALAAKKGVILVSGHFFANRVCKHLLKEIGFRILSPRTKFPIRDPNTGKIGKKYLKPLYIKYLNKVIGDYVFVQDKDCTLKILKRLRENGLVGINIDAKPISCAIEYPFLGTRYFFPAGFLHIVNLTDAVVVPMLCIGNSSSFTIIFDKIVEMQRITEEKRFMSVNLRRLVEVLESQVLQYPGQWEMWPLL